VRANVAATNPKRDSNRFIRLEKRTGPATR
jgi:hypothetical protein